jgi:3-isopropylmalate/(R)-2-methylmalate dehydratase large subunit
LSRTLYQKLWDSHVVSTRRDGASLIYIDRHLLHEVSTPQSFVALKEGGRRVRHPNANLAVADHAVPTHDRDKPIADPQARDQVQRLIDNTAAFGVPYIPLDDPAQGIVHVVGPEQGFTLPGITIVCGDSHTSTHGAFGALAFGIGASECAVVMATQCLLQRPSPTMRVDVAGRLGPWVSAKDLALHLIALIGANGGSGYAIEYTGDVVAALSMAGRMTLCNMTIEAGARVGLIAPDETTFAYLAGRPMAPVGDDWTKAVEYWRTLRSDPLAEYDRSITIDADQLEPYVTWGTSPQDASPISGRVPDPDLEIDMDKRQRLEKALRYMGLSPGSPLSDIFIDRAFIGSCTNSRIEDLRAAAAIVTGRHVASWVSAMVVPGSTATKLMAEREGLDVIFRNAGFEWRDAGCSMCVAINDDRLEPGQRCASTSNRNFEGRQGNGGRTHLMSPAMAAAAAIAGHLVDVRELEH